MVAGLTRVGAALGALVLAWPAPARALTCAPQPEVTEVLYPAGGATVPRDVTIFLRPGGASGRRLVLLDRGSRREVWLRIKREPGLWRLTPTKLLAGNRSYELRQLGALRSKPPTVLTSFRTGATIHRGGTPAFRKADISFSKPARRSMTHRPGRAARVAVEADPAPVVVETQVAFRGGRKWTATWRAAHRFASGLKVAGTHACDVRHPVAPVRGRYRVVLIPWGPTGERGRVLRLKGVIR